LDAAELQVGGSVEQMSYQVDGNDLSVTKGRTGLAFDREKVFDLAYDVACQSMTQVITEQKAVEVTIDLADEDVVTETTPDEPDFDAIHDAVYTEAKSAEMDATTHAVTDHTVGVDFDVSALKTAYDAAAEGETFSIPLTLTMPKDTKSELESKLFRDVLGQGTTKVSGSANRKSNVKLSAQACNGVILLPGEVFSYNSTTGSRTAEKGYLPAPVYSGSASVDEVGGGICQTSSTIYYAVLHTELKVVERAAHRYNTGYVDPGMDATVYYGSTDFRFENSTNYPIKIVTESYDSGGNRYLSVKIYGTNETGNYAVPKSTTYDTITPTTQYKADSSIPQGTTQVDTKQNPYTGLKAQTYRYIYDKAGNLLETQDMGVSSYKMRPKTIYYNPADGDPSTWTNGEPPKASSAETTQPEQSDNSEQEVEIQLPTVPDTGSSAENQTEQENSGQEETSSEQETAV
jgi:vancomycin resistance protein YoaR